MTLRLYLAQPTIVFAARVNQAAFDSVIDSVTFDTVTTGAYGHIQPGMTVLFGSVAAGDDYGRQRIRKDATADTIYIGRSSRGTHDGEVSPVDNAYITVLNDYRVWAKIPYISSDGTIYKDSDLTVGTDTQTIPPKANAGTGMAGTVDPTTALLTVSFSSSESYALSGTIASVLWDVGSGTITSGTSTSADITATFAPGFRWVSLTVTDSNGKSHTTRVPVYAHLPAADATIQAFEITNHVIRKEGQQLSIRILSDIPIGSYPDGTLVMLWEDEPANAADRSHMRFIGWHHIDPATIRAERTGTMKDTIIECLDVAGRLDVLPGFPISVENINPASSWLQMTNANMDKYIDYIFRWHSTAFEVAPVTLSGTGGAYPFVILGSDAQTIWDQAARRCQSLVPDYVLTCDTKGKIDMVVDPMIQQIAGRTATVQATLTESDWLDLSYTHQRYPRVNWLRSEAVLASSGQLAALFSVAPDTTPGQGESEQTNGEQLAQSQEDLNECEGNRYARLNARETNFVIGTTWDIAKTIEPAELTWVALNISAETAAQRGLTFTNENGLVHEMSIRYQQTRTGLVRDATINWERETDGQAAITYTPPETDITPPYEPDPGTGFDPNPADSFSDGFGTCYVMVPDHLGRTRNLSATSPAYVDITPASVGTMYDFILDPYDPTGTAYLTASTGVWKSTDLLSALPTFTNILTAATIEAALSAGFAEPYKIICSINVEDYVIFFFTIGNNLYNARSTNGGTSWTYTFISTITGMRWSGAADYVPHLVSGAVRLYVGYAEDRTNNVDSWWTRSDDSGATWSTPVRFVNAPIGSGSEPFTAHCPYTNNESGNLVYMYTDGPNDGGLYRSTNAGATWTKLVDDGVSIVRMGMETYTLDENTGYRWLTTLTFLTTDDAWATETTATNTGYSGKAWGGGGFPVIGGQYYVVSEDGIFTTVDSGENWSDKTGDFRSVMGIVETPSPDPITEGNSVIVPVWVVE